METEWGYAENRAVAWEWANALNTTLHQMRINVLIDNTKHPNLSLQSEHGLSIYFETGGYKFLMDVGASGKFAANAQALNIEISDVDYLILSHGHADHTGGLEEFFRINKKAKVYLSPYAMNKSYYSMRLGEKREISFNQSMVEKHLNRFIFPTENQNISENVALICQITHHYSLPLANKVLLISEEDKKTLKADNFSHEMALAVKTANGLIVFTGCSHSGLLNILNASTQYFGNLPVISCIGGTHLIDNYHQNMFETESDIKAITLELKRLFPQLKLYTGHCTGSDAKKILTRELGNRVDFFYSGAFINDASRQ